MNDDGELLRHFAETHDQASFRALVDRRIGFVYGVALRQLRDAHLAQDATQAVFVALARKAAHVAQSPNVMGWLHRSSCYECRNMRRAQIHRTARETEALRLGTAAPEMVVHSDDAELGALLDDALNDLSHDDRTAILARFFSGASFAEIAGTTGRTENAARMRVERALVKLRENLQRRGFTSSGAVLAGLLPLHASASVPAGLASSVTQAAFATIATAGLPLALLSAMKSTKIAATVAALAACGVIGYEVNKTNQLERQLVALADANARSGQTVRDLERQVVELKSTPKSSAGGAEGGSAAAKAAAALSKPEVEAPPPAGVTRKAPAGWHKNGANAEAYHVGVDQLQSWGGMPSAYAESKPSTPENSFGGMMQTTAAETYKNQRVKLSGWVRTEDAKQGGHLWLRIDGKSPADILGFDNMNKRAPQGTTDWHEYSVVLDVPPEATTLNYGFFVEGKGKMWVNGLTLQPVAADVPTTNLAAKREPPKAPVNLGFAPN